jgi:hypothetical protein
MDYVPEEAFVFYFYLAAIAGVRLGLPPTFLNISTRKFIRFFAVSGCVAGIDD